MDIFLVGKRSKNLLFVFNLPKSSWRKKRESSALPICLFVIGNSVWLQGNVLTFLSFHHERVELMPLWPFRSAVVVVFVDKWLLLDPLAGCILSPIILEVVGSLLGEKEPENVSDDDSLLDDNLTLTAAWPPCRLWRWWLLTVMMLADTRHISEWTRASGVTPGDTLQVSRVTARHVGRHQVVFL